MKDRFGSDWSKIKGTQFWRLPHVGRRMFFRHIASALSGYFLLPSRPAEGIAKAAGTHIGSVVAMELGGRPEDRTLPAFISLNASDGPGAGYFPTVDAPFYVSPNGGGITNSAFPNGADVFDRRYGMKLSIDTELEADPQ